MNSSHPKRHPSTHASSGLAIIVRKFTPAGDGLNPPLVRSLGVKKIQKKKKKKNDDRGDGKTNQPINTSIKREMLDVSTQPFTPARSPGDAVQAACAGRRSSRSLPLALSAPSTGLGAALLNSIHWPGRAARETTSARASAAGGEPARSVSPA